MYFSNINIFSLGAPPQWRGGGLCVGSVLEDAPASLGTRPHRAATTIPGAGGIGACSQL